MRVSCQSLSFFFMLWARLPFIPNKLLSPFVRITNWNSHSLPKSQQHPNQRQQGCMMKEPHCLCKSACLGKMSKKCQGRWQLPKYMHLDPHGMTLRYLRHPWGLLWSTVQCGATQSARMETAGHTQLLKWSLVWASGFHSQAQIKELFSLLLRQLKL